MDEARATFAKMARRQANKCDTGRCIHLPANVRRCSLRPTSNVMCWTFGRRSWRSPRRSSSSSTAAALSQATKRRRVVRRSSSPSWMRACPLPRSTTATALPRDSRCAARLRRAIQFIRSKAGEWSVDKTAFAAYGGSAGAGTSLWLAFHDDMADPHNADPVLCERHGSCGAGSLHAVFV